MKVVALFFACVALAAVASATITFPGQYLMEGTFLIPYFNISEPLRVVYDAPNHRERIDYYHGMDTFMYTQPTNYEIVPRINQKICMQNPGSADDLVAMVPDLTDGWNQVGVEMKNNLAVLHFQKVVKELNSLNSTYDFYVTPDGTPVELIMFGFDYVFGSHPDLYILRYDSFKAGYVNDKEFIVPDLCKQAVEGTGVSARRNTQQLRALLPYKRDVDTLFNEHLGRYGKKYHGSEHARRRNIFESNQRFIDHYNMKKALHTGITLKMNHYGDLEHTEFRTVMLPKRGRVSQNNGATAYHRPSGDVPASIDWRQLGAVHQPKDQGACGSCWTFGTTGTLQGMHFVKHGVLPSLSEQQIVDCAWGDRYLDSMGCDGGQTAGALQWIMDNGGIATEQSYHYLMQDGYCRNDTSSGVRVQSYVNVTMGDESALQSAVALGPVAIAIDAAHPEFEFYASGVYYNAQCKNGFNDLDHEVLAVGYGTDEDGQDYWIVQNSWSTYWGDQGYIKMARNRDNNCGIATDAVYPIVY